MAFLTYLLIFLLPLGQLGRITLVPGVNLYAHDPVVILILLTGFTRIKKLTVPSPLLAFISAMALSLILSRSKLQEVLTGSLYFWRYVAYAGVYVVLKQRPPKNILKFLIAAGFMAAVIGLLQYILLPDTRFLYPNFWDEHYYRLLGPWLDPGFTGLILVLTLLLLLENRRHFSAVIRYSLFVILFSALMLTYSRASYLSLLAGTAVLSWQKKSLKYIIGVVVLLAVSIAILPRPGGEGVKLSRTSSIIGRVTYTQKILPLIKQHPIFGVGFNLLRYKNRDLGNLDSSWRVSHQAAGVDNSFLFVLATTGIIGFVAFLWLIFSQLLTNHYSLITTSLVTVIVHSQFNNSLFYPWVVLWLWLIMARKSP